jgi:hypothetical protein
LFFSATIALGQLRSKAVFSSQDTKTDIPSDVQDLIKKAKKQTVFEVVGITRFSDQVLKADKIIFQPGSTLVLTGLRNADSLIIIAGEIVLQNASLANRIVRAPDFRVADGQPGTPGTQGQPNFVPPNETFRSANGGGGGNGGNGLPGETYKPPIVYILVGKMTHPVVPARFVIDFSGIDGANGGVGGAGGQGGHGDVGFTAHCGGIFSACESGPGRGGDGGPGGVGGQGGPASPGNPGFDLIIGGSDDFLSIAEQFTLLNKGGVHGRAGAGGNGGLGGGRGRGGQTCGSCNSRGDGIDGPPGGSLGAGAPSTEVGVDGRITFASGVDVAKLLQL